MGKSRKPKGGGEAVMWRLKGCPKCGGDVFVDRDISGWYEQCLQCGYLHDLNSIEEVKEQPREKKRELALAGSRTKP